MLQPTFETHKRNIDEIWDRNSELMQHIIAAEAQVVEKKATFMVKLEEARDNVA